MRTQRIDIAPVMEERRVHLDLSEREANLLAAWAKGTSDEEAVKVIRLTNFEPAVPNWNEVHTLRFTLSTLSRYFY